MRGSSGPKIVLTEAFSPSHIGNWALAECAVKRLKEAFPEADFTILARDKEGIERVIGEKTLEKLFPRMPHHENKLRQLLWLLPNTAWALAGLLAVVISRGDRARSGDMIRALTRGRARRDALDAIIQADLVVSIAGESINEMFSKKLPFVLYTYWLAATLGKPVLLFPQSFGPLRSALWRKMTALALSRCLMMARDIDSLGLLLDLGLPPERCAFVPDIAVTQVAIGPDEARALLEKLGV